MSIKDIISTSNLQVNREKDRNDYADRLFNELKDLTNFDDSKKSMLNNLYDIFGDKYIKSRYLNDDVLKFKAQTDME